MNTAALQDRRPLSPVIILGTLQAFDFLAIIFAGYVAFQVYIVWLNGEDANFGRYAVISLLGAILFLLSMRSSNAYDESRMIQDSGRIKRPLMICAGVFAALLTAGFLLKLSSTFSRGWALQWMMVSIGSLVVIRWSLRSLMDIWKEQGLLSRSVAVIGSRLHAEQLIAKLKVTRELPIRVTGLFTSSDSVDDHQIAGQKVMGKLDDLLTFARANPVDEIIIALPLSESQKIGEIAKALNSLPVDIRLSIDPIADSFPVRGIGATGSVPMIEIAERPLKHWNGAIKWLEDKILASAMLIILLPVMIVITIAILFDSRGPVFFVQERFGFNNNSLKVFKFRTMHAKLSDGSGVQRTVPGDPRVTKVGRILRRYSLDELPQLFNVLRGDMSLVGPRPHVPGMMAGEMPYYSVTDYFVRHRVRPGITGWAQVNGLRGEINNLEKAKQRVALDLYYIDHWSFWLDMKIIFMTAWIILVEQDGY